MAVFEHWLTRQWTHRGLGALLLWPLSALMAGLVAVRRQAYQRGYAEGQMAYAEAREHELGEVMAGARAAVRGLETAADALSRTMSLGTSLKCRRCTSVWPVVCFCSDSSKATANTLVMWSTTGCNSNKRQFSPSSGLKMRPNR